MFVRAISFLLLFAAAASAQTINIASPAAGVSTTSPVRVAASATSDSPIRLMQVYVDGVKRHEVKAASVDVSLEMTAGTRRVTVTAYDSDSVAKLPVTVSVTTAAAVQPPATQFVFTDVEEMAGWENCDACSGPLGAGDLITYSMTPNQSTPSMDGKSAKFHIEGNDSTDQYGSALWWKHTGPNDPSKNFVYETYFYIKDPARAQALEFDINQSSRTESTKYIFGTECDYRGTKQWRFYDNVGRKWVQSGVACTVPQAYTWNHVMLEFRKASDGTLHFISVTVNGKKSYMNKQSAPRRGTASSSNVNIAFQMDGNSKTEPYDVWLDGLTLRHW